MKARSRLVWVRWWALGLALGVSSAHAQAGYVNWDARWPTPTVQVCVADASEHDGMCSAPARAVVDQLLLGAGHDATDGEWSKVRAWVEQGFAASPVRFVGWHSCQAPLGRGAQAQIILRTSDVVGPVARTAQSGCERGAGEHGRRPGVALLIEPDNGSARNEGESDRSMARDRLSHALVLRAFYELAGGLDEAGHMRARGRDPIAGQATSAFDPVSIASRPWIEWMSQQPERFRVYANQVEAYPQDPRVFDRTAFYPMPLFERMLGGLGDSYRVVTHVALSSFDLHALHCLYTYSERARTRFCNAQFGDRQLRGSKPRGEG